MDLMKTEASEISGRTGLICLLGSPVAHSISPAMHNEAFRLLGMDYRYLAFDVGEEALPAAVEGLKALGARGWNLTMPDKSRMAGLCDALSPAAELTGSVNTVVNEGGVLTGHSTDGYGYMESVRQEGFDPAGKTMTLLGGGGAAAAICTQAALDGMKEIRVFNRKGRSLERMAELSEKLKTALSCSVRSCDLEDQEMLADSIRSSDILTNASSVGMIKKSLSVSGGKTEPAEASENDSLIRDPRMLRPDLFVSDIIYEPRSTRLLKIAQARRCRTANGLHMLLYQGAAAFRLWTGKEMPVEMIRQRFFQ